MVRILSNIDDVTRHLHSINMSGSLDLKCFTQRTWREMCAFLVRQVNCSIYEVSTRSNMITYKTYPLTNKSV